jgi:hypothetical protein
MAVFSVLLPSGDRGLPIRPIFCSIRRHVFFVSSSFQSVSSLMSKVLLLISNSVFI